MPLLSQFHMVNNDSLIPLISLFQINLICFFYSLGLHHTNRFKNKDNWFLKLFHQIKKFLLGGQLILEHILLIVYTLLLMIAFNKDAIYHLFHITFQKSTLTAMLIYSFVKYFIFYCMFWYLLNFWNLRFVYVKEKYISEKSLYNNSLERKKSDVRILKNSDKNMFFVRVGVNVLWSKIVWC